MYEGPLFETDQEVFRDKCQIENMYTFDIRDIIKEVSYTTLTKSQFEYIIKCQRNLFDAYKYAVLCKQPKDPIVELANIAIDLLNKYKRNKTIVNNEYSTDTDTDFKFLSEECEEYANRITHLSGVEFEVEKNWWEEQDGGEIDG